MNRKQRRKLGIKKQYNLFDFVSYKPAKRIDKDYIVIKRGVKYEKEN